jgi:hypothetical protein
MKTIKTQLKRLNAVIERVSPWSHVEDAAVYLGGEHDGIHISIGQGYYSVVRECEDGALKFVRGKGNIAEELKQAMADD